MSDVTKAVRKFLADPDHQRFGGRASELLRELLAECDAEDNRSKNLQEHLYISIDKIEQLNAEAQRLRGLLCKPCNFNEPCGECEQCHKVRKALGELPTSTT